MATWKVGDTAYWYNSMGTGRAPELQRVSVIEPRDELGRIRLKDLATGGQYVFSTDWLFRSEEEARKEFVQTFITGQYEQIQMLQASIKELQDQVSFIMEWGNDE